MRCMIFFHFLLSLHLASHADALRCMVTIGLAMAIISMGHGVVVRGVTKTIVLAMVLISLMSFGHGVVWVVALDLTIILSLCFSHVVVWVVGMGLVMHVSLAVGHPIAIASMVICFHSPATHIRHLVPAMRAFMAFLLASFVCGLVALH